MRIISGSLKGRILKSPKLTENVRPTADRAKETLFNILNNRFDFNGKSCIDLFCGTGNLGLEFLSRGGNYCTFVDLNINTVKENVSNFQMTGKSEIIRNDALRYLESALGRKFDFIFADPPYNYAKYDSIIVKSSLIASVLIIEHDKNFRTPENFTDTVKLTKKIGISNFTIFDFKE